VTLLDRTYLPPQSDVLVACSGGGDSVALLYLLAAGAEEYGWRLTVAHLDHRLRAESPMDADLTRRCAADLGLRCVVGSRDVGGERLPGESIEAAARRLRYEFLRLVRDEWAPGGLIATGHTADDQLETLALRLERKSGLRGVRSILPHREDGVVRPLLGARRSELRGWMEQRGIGWREDSTNVDVSFRRNRWRQIFEGLPEESYEELIAETAALTLRARALFTLYGRLAGWWLDRQSGPRLPGEIVLERLPAACHLGVLENALLEKAIEDSGADPRSVNGRLRRELIRLWRGESSGGDREGRVVQLGTGLWAESLPGGMLIARGSDPHWERGSGETLPLQLPAAGSGGTVTTEMPLGGGIEAAVTPDETLHRLFGGGTIPDVDGRWKAVLDAGALAGKATVRYPRAGDRMRPLGMDGQKRLADLFGEEGIPRLTRGRLPVVEAGGEILWVAGVRQAHGGRVNSETKQGTTLAFKTYY